MRDRKKHRIGVMGGGPGGLSAAMLLASKGHEVHVFEKESTVGGRNGCIRKGGYTFDIGPTFLMYNNILESLFEDSGERIEDHLKIEPLSPMYELRFHDKSLRVFHDRDEMAREIENHFPGKSDSYRRFMEKEEKRFSRLEPCLSKHYSDWKSFLDPNLLLAAPHLGIGQSVFDTLKGYFEDDQLSLAFSFQSKYLGMSAWECPAMFTMIPFLEHGYGIFHVEGGLSRISEVMQKIGTNKGAKFHLGTEVDQIMVENGVGKGFRLADGTEHHFDRIILNTDFGHLVNHNIDPEDTKRYTREKVNGMKYSCSTFMLYLGLDRKVDLPHHTIFFAEKYRECVEDVFDHLQLPEGISFYVRNADINDSTLSPEGHSSLYVLVPVPNLRAEIDWEKEKGPFRERVLQELEERGEIQGIRDHIKEEIVITPIDWQEKMNVHFGATFNLAHNLKQVACFRPPNIYCDFSNTYLVGGGTHPGSGLPTIYQSAKIAAEAINST